MFCQLFSLQNKSFLCLQHVENKGFQTVIKHRLKAIQKPIKNELGNREKNTENAHFVLKKCTFRFRDYSMNIKKVILGEKVPDKDDPNYKKRHEEGVEAGKSFARTMRLDKAAAKVQHFASTYPKLFLCLIFGFVLFSVGLNLYRMSTAVSYRSKPSSAVVRQEKELRFNRHHANDGERKEIKTNNNVQREEYGH